jgi:hypothetical protein
VAAIAADIGVSAKSLNRIAGKAGWVRRRRRGARGASSAQRLLSEAGKLEARAAASPDASAAQAAGVAGSEANAAASPATLPALIDRLERAVRTELASVEAMRAAGGRYDARSAQLTARTLANLTETLGKLQRLRAALPASPQTYGYDDDMPADIDEFRRDLARRIELLVASRADAEGDGED